MEENKRHQKFYKNDEITIVWEADLCTHVAYCFTELPEVFDPSERPWINAKGASTEKIIDQIKRCPTGALTFFYNNAPPEENKEIPKSTGQDVTVEIIKNGPAIIKGKATYINTETNKQSVRDKVFLCRCGKSKNLPWCDGEHLGQKFE